jgi:hypothetical protein
MHAGILCWLILIIFNFYLMFVLYRKNYDRSLSAWCVYFLFIPIFAFQCFGSGDEPNVFVAGLISIFPAMVYWVLKTDCKPVNNGKGIKYILLLSFLICIFGTLDISQSGRKKQLRHRKLMSQATREESYLNRNFFNWYDKQNLKDQELAVIKSNISSYIKTNFKMKDQWGTRYRFLYRLDKDDDIIRIWFEVKSAGMDRRWNTIDDLSSWKLIKRDIAEENKFNSEKETDK